MAPPPPLFPLLVLALALAPAPALALPGYNYGPANTGNPTGSAGTGAAKAGQARTVAVGGDAGWSFLIGQLWKPPVLRVGDRLTFTGSSHSVYQFPSKAAFDACDFSSAKPLARTLHAPFTSAPFAAPGVFYFGCNVPAHCRALGQKIAIQVLPRPKAP